MIIFCADGRLGNQLFQYAFLQKISVNNDYILLLNSKDIFGLFDIKFNGICINNKYFVALFSKLLVPCMIIPLVKLKLISIVKQGKELTEKGYYRHCDSYSLQKRLLPITFVETSYYQSEKFIDSAIINQLHIRTEYLELAKNYLSVIPLSYHKIFIHVRRGDYDSEDFFGDKGICLPLSYYTKQIQWFKNNVSNPFFIFISDDPDFVESNFNNVEPKLISRNSFEVDFAVMTECNSAIISHSSFSWWGAYLMKDRFKVFSPKYWFGFRMKIEFPQGIQPAFADVVAVEDE